QRECGPANRGGGDRAGASRFSPSLPSSSRRCCSPGIPTRLRLLGAAFRVSPRQPPQPNIRRRERRTTTSVRSVLLSAITAPPPSAGWRRRRPLMYPLRRRRPRPPAFLFPPTFFSVPAHLLALEFLSVLLNDRRHRPAACSQDEEFDDPAPPRGNATSVPVLPFVLTTLLATVAAMAQDA